MRPTTTERGRPEAWVCGLHAVSAALARAPEQALELFLDRDRDDRRLADLEALAGASGVSVQRVPRRTLDRFAAGVTHQGAVLRRRGAARDAWAQTLERLGASQGTALVLALDGVTDPHNLGACLRSAAGAGVDTVLYPRSRGGGINATVRRVACGGAELVHLQEVANLARALGQLAGAGWYLAGLDGEARRSVFEAEPAARTVLVAGGEERGLRRLTREACSELLAIPMASRMPSLNVSVATGIALFAVREAQRRLHGAAARPRADRRGAVDLSGMPHSQ